MTDKNIITEGRPKFWPIYLFLLIITLVASAFSIYELFLLSSIEDGIRYFVIVLFLLLDLLLIFKVKKLISNKKRKVKKKSKHIGIIIFMIVYSLICSAIGGVIYYVYGEVSSLNKVFVTYTSDLIVASGSEVKDIKDVKNLKIAMLEDEKSVEGNIIPKEIVKENNLEDDNEIVDYTDYTSMVVDLYSGEIDACFVSGNYISLFSSISEYEHIGTDTRVVISKSKKMKKSASSESELASSGKNITEPFTILLMGIDSTDEVLAKNAVANGDTLILITFNPKTLNATMLSIPRDSYVPIACWKDKAENKITHAAAYGNDCMINTIENFLDVNIDYYAKINFKGLVKLVDAVGGVEIDVEKRLCTDDSGRINEVCIDPGLQVLNGEQALVYARNRKQLANGDFGRNYHQQVLVMALMNKVKEIKDVNKFLEILNTISNSMDTNFTTKQILSFYNVAKDIIMKSLSTKEANLVNIERLYLQGSSQMIYDERSRLVLYNYVPNQNSRKDIIQAMKQNLELVKTEPIKEFSFSINKLYEKEVVGYGPYKSGNGYTLLPDFTGDSEATATATCSRLGIKCSFVGTGGYVVNQSIPAGKRIDKISGGLSLTLSQNNKDKDSSTSDKTTDKDKKPSTKPDKDTEDKDDEKDTEDKPSIDVDPDEKDKDSSSTPDE